MEVLEHEDDRPNPSRPRDERTNGVEYPAFALNITLLFTLGLVTARWSHRSWATAIGIGAVDAMLGVVVVVANAVIK